MTLDQCQTIISELFEPRWPNIGPGKKSEWSTYFTKEVVWEAVKTFDESIARTAALRLAQEKTYVPKAAVWAKECKRVYAEQKGRDQQPVRVHCEACGGCGWISFRAPRVGNDATRVDYRAARHVLDSSAPTDGWYSYVIPCECTNATEKLYGATAEDRYAVIAALREFATETFGRDASEVSDAGWCESMERIGGNLATTERETKG